jgi:hypothetical protein
MAKSFEGGDTTDTETMRGRDWPSLRQFCVFLENHVGRLSDLMRQLESLDTRVIAMSIFDSVDFAMVRLMFNNADRAREKLELSGFLFSESDVIGVELPEGEKPFHEVCSALVSAEVNIHHAYPLLYRRQGRAAIAMFVDDVDLAVHILRETGHRVVAELDLQDDDEYL